MRHALRSLWKARDSAALAIGIIAVAIGANTAVFSIVDTTLLRPLPFEDPSRLFVLTAANSKRAIVNGPFSYPAFRELRSRVQGVAGLAAVASEQFNDTSGNLPEQLPGGRVSAAFFDVIGIRPVAGRGFTAADDTPGAAPVVIVGRRFWTARFGGRDAAVGATLRLNGMPAVVVGALGRELPPPFDGVDVWAPQVDRVSGYPPALIEGGLGYLTAIVRLAPGALVEQTQRDIDRLARDYAKRHPGNTDADPDGTLALTPIGGLSAGGVRVPLLLLMGAVGLVLLVACANVANLLLVRATARTREVAVRLALGASRLDVIRWLGTESLVLAALGGALGVALAYWLVVAVRVPLADLPRGTEIAVDLRVLVFSLLLSAGAGVVSGFAPIVLACRQSPVDALRAGGRTVARGRGPLGALVVGEVALSFLLLVLAGLLIRSLDRLTRVPLGFEPRGLLTLRVSLPSSRYPDPDAMRRFMDRLVPGIGTAPGVASAAASMALPPAITTMAPYVSGDQPLVPIGERPVGEWAAITPGYFDTLGIPLIAGRSFTPHDTAASPLVVVVSDGFARRTWPGRSALGRTLLVGRFPGFAEVVGVVGDVRNNGLGNDPMPAMYTPYVQRPWPNMQFAIRVTEGNPLGVLDGVKAAVRTVDPDLAVTRVETMSASLAASIVTERRLTWILSAFAAIALVLAMSGLYGVLSFGVARRAREIGTRIALGAEPSAVVRLIALEGFRLTIAGMALGAAAAAAVSQLIHAVLHGVSAADGATYAAVIVLFTLTAFAALLLPARRATRIDPQIALRAD